MKPSGGNVHDLPLFAEPVPAFVRHIQGQNEDAHDKFLTRLRERLAFEYAGTGTEISTDHAWATMTRWGISLPEGASPNCLGSLFSGWSRATPKGWTRSKRDGAHANLLRQWQIT